RLPASVARGGPIARELQALGVITAEFPEWAPDYQTGVEENQVKFGRLGMPMTLDRTTPIAGVGQAARFAEELPRLGVDVRCEHAVVAVVVDDGRVVGVRVQTPEGLRHLRARGGVVFGSGGFTHDRALRRA